MVVPTLLFGLLFFPLSSAFAADLHWGSGGLGGTGTWNAANNNWWNGSSNIAWISGSDAFFGGTAGTLTLSGTQSVHSLTFNVPGYVLQSGWISSSSPTLVITTNSDAQISSTLSGPINDSLLKAGFGTLSVSGTNFMDTVQITGGEYKVSGTSSLFFSDVIMQTGTTLTLAQNSNSSDIRSLTGNGIVRPNNQARTVTATLWDSGNFSGTIQNNGSGILAISIFSGGDAVELTGTNSYTGDTKITLGTLELSENGSILGSPNVNVSYVGTLRLDNSGIINGDRVADAANINLQGGRMEFMGSAVADVAESVGTLTYAGAAKISVTRIGTGDALLSFAVATRVSKATVDISGDAGVTWTGLSNNVLGVLEPFITFDGKLAIIGTGGRIEAFNGYVTDLNTAGASDHVNITTPGSTAMAFSKTIASLNLENSGASANELDLSGFTLTVDSGAVFSSGTAGQTISNGEIFTASDIVINNSNSLSISADMSGDNLIKSGIGLLILSGNNIYTGDTHINEGTVEIASDAALGNGALIALSNQSTLKAAASFTSTKGFSGNGQVDTNGNNLEFSGANTGNVLKLGAGTLTLSNSSVGVVTANSGTLILENPTAGSVYVANGSTLVAKGNLSYLELRNGSTLDIGGSDIAVLTAQAYRYDPFSSMEVFTLKMSVDNASADLLVLNNLFLGGPTGIFEFSFEDVGGALTGVDYLLMSMPGALFGNSNFSVAISSDALALGWIGIFTVTPDAVTINFSAVPEPTTIVLLVVAILIFLLVKKKRTSGAI